MTHRVISGARSTCADHVREFPVRTAHPTDYARNYENIKLISASLTISYLQDIPSVHFNHMEALTTPCHAV